MPPLTAQLLSRYLEDIKGRARECEPLLLRALEMCKRLQPSESGRFTELRVCENLMHRYGQQGRRRIGSRSSSTLSPLSGLRSRAPRPNAK